MTNNANEFSFDSDDIFPDAQKLREATHMLMELLKTDDDRLDLSFSNRMFLLNTCAATLIEHVICRTTGFRSDAAIEGLDSLVTDMRSSIEKLCTAYDLSNSEEGDWRLLEITEAEYRTYGIKHSGEPLTTEERWFKCEGMLGILLFDNIDKDWSFVAMSYDNGEWHAFDLGTSHATQELAFAAMGAAFLCPPFQTNLHSGVGM